MVLAAILLACAATIVCLYVFLKSRERTRVFRTAVYLGCALGTLRAALASLGWYVVEHTGGPLQIPAYVLAMLAWPEAALLSTRRTAAAPFAFYVQLSVLLVITTVLALVSIAAVARQRQH